MNTDFQRQTSQLRNLTCFLLATFACISVVSSVQAGHRSTTGNRWMLICCGLTGDDEHREKMTTAVSRIHASAMPVFDVALERITLLVADQQMQQDLEEAASDAEVCTLDSVRAEFQRLSATLGEDDSLFVVFVGHAHLNGSDSQFNVMDSDFDQDDVAKWTRSLKCKEQIFFLTQPVSGFWIRPLRRPGRVVITATEADLEFTGTEMPYAFADVLAGVGDHGLLKDHDEDGQISLFDLYITTNLEIDGRFTAMERLQTEHAQLDDNGDGRGSELQQPYLPVRIDDEEVDAADTDNESDDNSDNVDDTTVQEELDEDNSENEAAEEDNDGRKEDLESPATDEGQEPHQPRPALISSSNLDGYLSRFILLKSPIDSSVTNPAGQDAQPTESE